MPPRLPLLTPAHGWKVMIRSRHRQGVVMRKASTTAYSARKAPHPPRPPLIRASDPEPGPKHITVHRPPPYTLSLVPQKDPIAYVTAQQLETLDPTGARTTLFSRANPDAVKVGDVLLVRQKSGDSFAGVCINIRRRGVDTGILLRNELTRVGVEMWFKIYSPTVEAVEVVLRREKRARRARLYYMRKPKHDMRSVHGLVQQYLRKRSALSSGDIGKKGVRPKGGKVGKNKGGR
ncbi:MAG: hypothetical protein M1833_001872 [Piccolia ochrophora]|nr:MAG: hypothetical protein M1833_001872 [Piccolia ochrophora]